MSARPPASSHASSPAANPAASRRSSPGLQSSPGSAPAADLDFSGDLALGGDMQAVHLLVPRPADDALVAQLRQTWPELAPPGLSLQVHAAEITETYALPLNPADFVTDGAVDCAVDGAADGAVAASGRPASGPSGLEQGFLRSLAADLAAGKFAWIGLSSKRTLGFWQQAFTQVGADLGQVLRQACAQGTRLAAVGAATAAAWQAFDLPCHLYPTTRPSAASLLQIFPAPGPHGQEASQAAGQATGQPAGQHSQRILLPGSALAAPTLGEGLRAGGWQVTELPLYSTRTRTDLPGAWLEGLQAKGEVFALLTASSAARAAHELLTGNPSVPALPRALALGQPTAATLAALGWEAAATCPSPGAADVLATLLSSRV